jgi:hypothetical protein
MCAKPKGLVEAVRHSQRFKVELEIAFVNRTDIYRRAIKRTFADLYGVSPDTVDVSWTTGKTIVCTARANRSFIQSSAIPMTKRPSSLASMKTPSSST